MAEYTPFETAALIQKMLARAGIMRMGNSWFHNGELLCPDEGGWIPCDHPNVFWLAEEIALVEARQHIAAGEQCGFRLDVHGGRAENTDWGAIVYMYNQYGDEMSIYVDLHNDTISTRVQPNRSRRVQSMCRTK